MRAVVVAMLIPALSSGCAATVRTAFQARVDATLATPAPLPQDWRPDATVYLSPDVVQAAVQVALASADLSAPLSMGGLQAVPRLTVRSVTLRPPSAPCGPCLGVDGSLDGSLSVGAFGLRTDAAVQADVGLDVALRSERSGTGWDVILVPERLTAVDVRFDGSALAGLGRLSTGPLEGRLTETLLDRLPPLRALTLGGDALPVRDLRVQATPRGVRLDLRTQAPTDAFVAPAPRVDAGWSARVSTEAVLAMVRAELFRQGPLQHGVWVDPTALTLTEDGFTLAMRLWRPKGGAWWRDLSVTGKAQLNRGALELVARDVVLVQTSPGAKFADPAVALAEARVLQAIADTTRLSLPMSQTHDLAGARATWRVTSLVSEGDDLVAQGVVRFKADGP